MIHSTLLRAAVALAAALTVLPALA